MTTLIIIIAVIAVLAFASVQLILYYINIYVETKEHALKDCEDIVMLCLNSRKSINIDNAEDLKKNVAFLSPEFSQTARVMLNNIFIPGDYSYRVMFDPDGGDDYQWWTFNYKVESASNVIGIIVDMSDVMLARELKKETRLKAAEARKQDTFMSSLSDSLRLPLNDITYACTELANNESLSENQKKAYCDVIADNNNFLINQISDILLFSRINSGRQLYDMEKIDVGDFMMSLYKETLDTMPENINLIMEYGRKGVVIEVDIKRLQDILSQYISNAKKFTSEGFIALGWQYHLDTHECELFVEDSGLGISADKQSTIFGMFSKLHEFADGVGLGLNIAKSLAEAMGGYITVDSSEGTGSRFCVWFKATAAPFVED